MAQAVVQLEDFKVTIKELRIRDILKVVGNIKEIFDEEDLDIQKLVEEKFDLIIDIVSGFIVVTGDDYTLEDLTFSDIDKLTPEFKAVNQSFLDKMSSMGLTASNLLPTPTDEDQPQTQLEEDSTTQSST